MKRIKINDSDSKDTIEEKTKEIAEILASGGVMAFPADTVWGLGASGISKAGIEKIRHLKQRKDGHPFPVYIESEEYLHTIADYPNSGFVKALSERFWPGSLTMVLPLKQPESDLSIPAYGKDTLGFRVPDSQYLCLICHHLGCPLANTSANMTGMKVFETSDEIVQLWETELDLLVTTTASDNTLEPAGIIPSTVIGVTATGVTMFREGKISRSDLDSVLSVVKR